MIATDVLWSDPAPGPGLVENEARGVGLLFGPDVTQVALAALCTTMHHCCMPNQAQQLQHVILENKKMSAASDRYRKHVILQHDMWTLAVELHAASCVT